jgi:probable HAF family extracellular repeat protein
MFRGFIWTAATGMVELGTLGGNNSYANGINSSGEVVGEASLANGYDNAFLAVGAMMTDLGTLGGGNSYAYGINDSGTVVGYSAVAGGDSHAFIYVNGVMLDLNSLIGNGSGWDLLEAYGINSTGEIVGEGMFDGESHAFLLDPENGFSTQASSGGQAVPEPGSRWLVGIGMGLVMVCVWREKLSVK